MIAPAEVHGDPERQDRIVQAALDLLLVADYDDIQMLEVAGQAEMGLSTVYRYFSSKERLFIHVLMRWASSLPGDAIADLDPAATNRERIAKIFDRIVTSFARQPQFYRTFMRLQWSADPVVRQHWDEMAQSIDTAYRAAIVGLTDDDRIRVTRAATAILDAQLRQWIFGRRTIDGVRMAIADALYVIFDFADPTIARP